MKDQLLERGHFIKFYKNHLCQKKNMVTLNEWNNQSSVCLLIPRAKLLMETHFILFMYYLILTWGYVFLLLILEGERETEGETTVWERNIHRLPPKAVPIRDRTCSLTMCPDQCQTHDLVVYGTMLQPTEPPGQAWKYIFKGPNWSHHY